MNQIELRKRKGRTYRPNLVESWPTWLLVLLGLLITLNCKKVQHAISAVGMNEPPNWCRLASNTIQTGGILVQAGVLTGLGTAAGIDSANEGRF